jgi:hypothetical protein
MTIRPGFELVRRAPGRGSGAVSLAVAGVWCAAAVLSVAPTVAASAILPGDEVPTYLRDRGTGVATSLFGTYVRGHELLVYPFYEYTKNKDQEYKPSELGYAGDQDYRAEGTEHEALIFLSYGISENVALEVESAGYTWGVQHKAADDTSAVPSKIEEQGFGDTQAELRWRWWQENERRPEFWSYFEITFPFQRDRTIIGTQDWEFVQGFGLTRGFRFGTLTGRISASYTAEDTKLALGEYALEYLKRVSPGWRVYLGVEGEEDEVAAIGEVQWQIAHCALLKLNNGFGLTSKAPDLAPEVGIVFSF